MNSIRRHTAPSVAESAITLDAFRIDHATRPGRGELNEAVFQVLSGGHRPRIHGGLGLTLDDVLAYEIAEYGEFVKGRLDPIDGFSVKLDEAYFHNGRIVAVLTDNNDAERTFTLARYDGKFPTAPTRMFY